MNNIINFLLSDAKLPNGDQEIANKINNVIISTYVPQSLIKEVFKYDENKKSIEIRPKYKYQYRFIYSTKVDNQGNVYEDKVAIYINAIRFSIKALKKYYLTGDLNYTDNLIYTKKRSKG